jgi:hypothetical protein
MSKLWKNEAELAALIMRQAKADQRVILTPHTAHFVALKPRAVAKKPTIRDVIGVICDRKCPTLCNPCQGKADTIVRAYGSGLAGDLSRARSRSVRERNLCQEMRLGTVWRSELEMEKTKQSVSRKEMILYMLALVGTTLGALCVLLCGQLVMMWCC